MVGSEETYDIVIIGGGVMGCSVAYHLLRDHGGLAVAVVERDPTYVRASSTLSVGNARIQFSLESNIRISQYTLAILERFAEEMEVDGERPDVGFRREGNLFLLDAARRQAAEQALALQQRLGCAVEWWDTAVLADRQPLLRCNGLIGATFGPMEGHLDGYAFLMAYRNKARSLGAVFVRGEVQRVAVSKSRVEGVELASGKRLAAAAVVNCAGAWASQVAATAGVTLPIVPVQRQVFIAEPELPPPGPLPLINLPSGLYFRTEGERRILVGQSLDGDPVGFDFRWQEARFNDFLWPRLAAAVPAWERLRLIRGWAGLYAVNTLDSNAILGPWPGLRGFFLANGFSGHGLQQAPAVGRYLAECILDRAPELDLSAFGAERVIEGRSLLESAIV